MFPPSRSRRVLNEGGISASAASDTGNAVAFRDLSGSVSSFVNEGTLAAALSNFDDGDDATEEGEPSGLQIAADLSVNTSGVAFENDGIVTGDVRLGEGNDSFVNMLVMSGDLSTGGGDDTIVLDGSGGPATNFFGFLSGDVATGGGDDDITVSDGAFLGQFANRLSSAGTVSLGAGFDTLTVTGAESEVFAAVDFGGGGGAISVLDGGTLRGSLAGADDVALTLGDQASSLVLTDSVTRVGSLTTLEGIDPEGSTNPFANGGVLSFAVDVDGQTVSSLDVTGDAVVADDTTFRTVFAGAFADDLSAPIITAGGTLDIDLSNAAERLDPDGVVPFLFRQSLSLSDDGQSVVLNLERRSADDLGLDPIRTAIYDPVINSLVRANSPTFDADGQPNDDADVETGRALFNIGATGGDNPVSGEERFLAAFDQFLPAPLDAPLTYARAQTSSVTSIVTQRVTKLRESTARERTAWLQESSYFVDRDGDGGEQGFDGGGFVIALGADTPLGPIDTIGLSAAVGTARYDEELGEDFPFDRLTYTVGAYAAETLGALQLDGRVSYGWASSESERNVFLVARDPGTGRATGEGDVSRLIGGEWDGTQLNAYGRALYAGRVGGWDVQPFASLDFLKLDEDAYEEFGEGTRAVALRAAGREATSLRGNAGLILGREFKTRPSRFDTSIPATIAPRLTVAYSDEFDGDDLEGIYRFQNGEDFVLTQEKPGGAAIVGADIAYENEYARLGVGGSLTASDEVQIYTLRVGVGLKW